MGAAQVATCRWTSAPCPRSVEPVDDPSAYAPPPDQEAIVAALRRGDEQAFAALVDEYSPSMLRVARMYVSTRAVAEEVVQEAWLGVISGIGRFEGRSSLKTWIFTIVANVGKTRGEREGRSIPLSSIAEGDEEDGRTVDADRHRARAKVRRALEPYLDGEPV